MKKKKNTALINIFLIVFFTVLVLWLALRNNFNEVMGVISQVSLTWVLVVLGVAMLKQIIIGYIIMVLTKLSNKQYKFRQGIVNSFIASFFHGVTPSASGGQIAQLYVFKKQGIGTTDSVSVLWMDFIIYQSSMVGLVLILLILRFTYFYDNYSQMFFLVLIGFAVNSLVIVGLWLLAKFPRCYRFITTTGVVIGAKLRIIKDKEKTIHNIDYQLEKFSKETEHLKSNKISIAYVVFLNIFRLVLYYSIPYFCALAIGLEIPTSMLIDIIALSSFVSMINAFIPIPGASGGTEATFIMMFSGLFGVVNATSCMILWRFVSYYLILLIGGIVFVVFKFISARKESLIS